MSSAGGNVRTRSADSIRQKKNGVNETQTKLNWRCIISEGATTADNTRKFRPFWPTKDAPCANISEPKKACAVTFQGKPVSITERK